MYTIFAIKKKSLVPESRCGSAPRSPRADPDVVLFVDVLQKLDIDPLVAPLGISEVAEILSQKHNDLNIQSQNSQDHYID